MYGPWILAIIFSSLIVVFGVLCLVCHKLEVRYYTLAKKCRWDDVTRHDKYIKKGDIVDGVVLIIGLICIVSLIVLTTVCTVGVAAPFVAKRDILEFEEYKIVVEEAYGNGTDLDNIGMTENIIHYNKWLAEAKASKKLFGNFSRYYKYDIESMEYISVGGVS